MTRHHPCYQGRHSHNTSNEPNLQRVLGAGPWFWPPVSDVEARDAARQHCPAGPPDAQPGQIPLLAYNKSSTGSGVGSLWVLAPECSTDEDGVRDFRPAARKSWRNALAAVPRSVPVIRRPLDVAGNRPPPAREVGHHGNNSARVLDGNSFGLAFALSIISRVFDIALPDDIAATATIDNMGNTDEVDALDAKLSVLRDFAPGVRRCFVACEQSDLPDSSLGGVELIRVSSVREAVDKIFPDLARRIIDIDRDRRPEFIDELFEVAISLQGRLSSWKVVADTAAMALEKWEDLNARETAKLQMTHSFAARHEGHQQELELPKRDWIDEIAQPFRLRALAHLTQQSTSTTVPEPQRVLDFVNPYLETGPDAFGDHLRLMGALGRLHYTCTEFQKALKFQRDAVDGWFDRRLYGEISYPLSFAWLTAGSAGFHGDIDDLKKYEKKWKAHAGANPKGFSYVRVCRGRAMTQLGHHDEALELLEEIIDDGPADVAPTLRAMALRWMLYILRHRHSSEDIEARNNELKALAADCDRAHKFELLRRLDAALFDEDQHRALELADDYLEAFPQPARYMLEASGRPRAQWPAFMQQYIFE